MPLLPRFAALAAGALLAACAGTGPDRLSNRHVADNFVRVMFEREYQSQREPGPLRKWTTPVRLMVHGESAAPHLAEVDELIGRLRRLTGLDIARVENEAAANFNVVFSRDIFGDLKTKYRRFYGRGIGEHRFDDYAELISFNGTMCFAAYGNGRDHAIASAVAFIPTDLPKPADIHHCIVEEIVQAFGPSQDIVGDRSTMFCDCNAHNDMTWQDEMFLRVLYDPRLKPGMDREAARAAALDVLAGLRPGA